MTETVIDKLLEDDEVLKAMLQMPDSANEEMVERRREASFSFMWEQTSLSKEQIISDVKDREQELLEDKDYSDLPDWLVRMEAQDILMILIHERVVE